MIFRGFAPSITRIMVSSTVKRFLVCISMVCRLPRSLLPRNYYCYRHVRYLLRHSYPLHGGAAGTAMIAAKGGT